MKKGIEEMLPAEAVKAGRDAFSNVATIGMKLTDLGNAERLVARFRDRIRYCPPRKKWLVYDGRRWKWDEDGEVMRLAKKTARTIYNEAEHATDKDHAQAIAKHAHASEKAERLAAMIKLASTENGIAVMSAELDANHWLFNVENGTIELKTGELRPHDRADMITKLAPVQYSEHARSDLWFKFLTDATGGDTELAAYIRRVAGYAMQGTVSEKAFFFWYGPPDGMKSTFIDATAGAFGDYAVTAAFTTWLVQTNTGGNRGDIVSLMGARLVTSVEVRKGARFDEEILKKVTGGDELKYAAKFEADVAFFATFALWLAGNDAPVIRDDDEGAWSRVRRIPFTHPLPEDKQDRNFREKLRAPEVQAAILAWAVGGCLEWQRDGLGTCAAVEQSSAEYRAEMDRAAGFFSDRCAFETGASVPRTDLRDAYESWCREQGIKHPLSGNDFAKRLRERGIEPGKSHGTRKWKGVRLLTDDEEPEGTRGTPGGTVSPNSPMRESQENFRGNMSPGEPAAPGEDDDLERDAIQADGGGE